MTPEEILDEIARGFDVPKELLRDTARRSTTREWERQQHWRTVNAWRNRLKKKTEELDPLRAASASVPVVDET